METDEVRVASIVLVSEDELRQAWDWLVASISPRPSLPLSEYVYDHKTWDDGVCCGPLACHEHILRHLAHLYLASQLGDHRAILDMTNGGGAPAVAYLSASLDVDAQSVIEDERRFRNHLSEHLSFWVRLATERRQHLGTDGSGARFGHTRPNIQPEDKGEDGLLLVQDESSLLIELLSVKNSTGNPQSMISTASFRAQGAMNSDGDRGCLLVGFYLVQHRSLHLLRLDDMLTQVCSAMGVSADEKRRRALLTQAVYNGVVVANDAHAHEALFVGFRHVRPDPTRCIGTYIGSQLWQELAENVRSRVMVVLERGGLL